MLILAKTFFHEQIEVFFFFLHSHDGFKAAQKYEKQNKKQNKTKQNKQKQKQKQQQQQQQQQNTHKKRGGEAWMSLIKGALDKYDIISRVCVCFFFNCSFYTIRSAAIGNDYMLSFAF